MIVVDRRPRVLPAPVRQAIRLHHYNAALTAMLCVTAVAAFAAGLMAVLHLSWGWTAVSMAYAIAAGFWGGYRAADAQPVLLPETRP